MWSLLTVLAFAPSTAEAQRIPEASYKLQLDTYDIGLNDYRFPSGLRIIFQSERSQPMVAITSAIDRGSEHDQEDMDGIAHVVEHLAFRAQHGDLPKNWDLIKQLGGSINASTSVDWTNYMTIAPVDSLVPLLTIEVLRMADGVANVTQEHVTTEAEIARNELRMRYENAAVGSAWDALGASLFPEDHPYARSTIGSHETLGNLTIEKVQEYVDDNYRPEFFTIVIVGDINLDDSSDVINRAFMGHEDLLMAPEDAEAFLALEGGKAQEEFLADWYPTLQEYMIASSAEPFTPRVDCDGRAEPPPPVSQETSRVKGMVDNETVVLAWSLPGGYCDDGPTMNMTASLLTNYIYQSLYPSWEYSKEDSVLDGIGCFASADQYFTQLICFIEPSASGGYSSERLIGKAADALYQQWQPPSPQLKPFMDWNFNYARMSSMASMLQSVDEVSTLGGRATATAMFTHFTGDPQYFSRNMNRAATLSHPEVQELAKKYVTRDRMVSVIVEPMDEEERERREAAASASSRSDEVAEYHATTDADRYASLFDEEDLSPENISQTTVTPDLDKLHRFTLDNGLEVAVLPYGEAPLVQVQLQVKGSGSMAEPFGINSLGEALYTTGSSSNERLLAVAGFMSGGSSGIAASGSSGNVDALLHKIRWQVEDYDWYPAEQRLTLNSWVKSSKSDGNPANGDAPSNWSSRMMYERLFPNHIMGEWNGPEDYEAMREWEMSTIKQWIYSKWRPGNAELFVVGKVDPAEVEASARKYFDSWEYKGEGEPQVAGDMPIPTEQPERQVLLFDKPIATQSQIVLGCQVKVEDKNRDYAKALVVGDVLSEMAWRKLREEAGVTYGAGAYTSVYDGGAALLSMSSLVQNDSVGFGVKTMFDLIQKGAAGEVDRQALANAKWSRARKYVLGQQSSTQMLSRLAGTGLDNISFFETYPTDLGNVSVDDFAPMLSTCEGQEVVTIVGPKAYAEEQLQKEGIAYEVIEWEAMYEAQLDKKELKKYLKRKAKAAESAESAESTEG
jgi:zinc protease